MNRLLEHPWWIPLVFALLVAGVGSYAYRTLADSMRASLRDELQTILDTEVAAIELWTASQRSVARTAARQRRLRDPVAELVEIARTVAPAGAPSALRDAPAAARVRELVEPQLREYGYGAYAVLGRDGVVLAAQQGGLLGTRIPLDLARFDAAIRGETVLSRPVGRVAPPTEGEAAIVMRVAAPVAGPDGAALAVLGFEIPVEGFTEVLRLARAGESGETYAFDADGVLLSQSRFDAQLVELGLLTPDHDSILSIEVRDPGGNLAEGFTPTLPLRARPLTRMAAAAVSGESGVDIDGYPDYRGVPVVGAWTWLEDLGMGVATEIDLDEAYAGLGTVRRSFAAVAGVLGLAALTMLGYTLVLGQLQRRYETARRLGRYKIVEKIGEGGMGKVYRAEHALLRRPTAVKLLESSSASDEAVKRFEREVQAAACLTHPNTIAVYDYGRTPEGSFYYAMEYLEGISLAELVGFDGAQCEARALHFMRQASSSLAEAHGAGLIHRDLKPSNLMICTRGGLADFVKVLDFGLVRATEDELHVTSTHSLTGTPLYLSPEALEEPDSVDTRSDVYQLGAVLYYLLTGRPVFQGESLVEILSQHLSSAPVPPSEALGHPISADLEKLVLACLAKDRGARPENGAALLAALEACRVEGVWSQEEARAWWLQWSQQHPTHADDASGSSAGSMSRSWVVDLAGRFDRSRSGSR